RVWACAVLALVTGVLSGCGGERSTPDDATVRVMVPAGERPFWRPIVERFERLHSGAHVELIEGPESTDLREDLYTAALMARDPTFDLVYMDVTWTAKFAAAGWLRPLDDFAGCDALLRPAVDAGRYAGRLYRIPVRTDVGMLYARRDLLDAAHVPAPQT